MKRFNDSKNSLKNGYCFILLMLVLLLAVTGCKQQQLMHKYLDEDSISRLTQIPADATVVLLLIGDNPSEIIPLLDSRGRQLGWNNQSTLVETPVESLTSLAEAAVFDKAIVWGDGSIISKMTPFLRNDLLAAFNTPEAEQKPISLIARFSKTADVSALLKSIGLSASSVTGGIATISAQPNEILQMLSLPDLVQLKKPSTMLPSGN